MVAFIVATLLPLLKVSSIAIQMEHYQFEGKRVGESPTQLQT